MRPTCARCGSSPRAWGRWRSSCSRSCFAACARVPSSTKQNACLPATSARNFSHGTAVAVSQDMDIVTWLIVGLVAGVLAGLVVGGYGLLAAIVVGIIGAFIGGWLFAHMGWHTPI